MQRQMEGSSPYSNPLHEDFYHDAGTAGSRIARDGPESAAVTGGIELIRYSKNRPSLPQGNALPAAHRISVAAGGRRAAVGKHGR